ncbi:UDP-N-acetylmuramate dehydrogenase [Shewanella pneumatophori]|uniref:UDP-N-acetylenolpyruvoylglucosamine reductase n=1 Tax=Shewanella pneumatophori TaxID=314092 RepID=A0A9X1ZEP3_9GAMM|nr:UDP-N-acetylmuramate dehydrogenase [Shewanella pneumatophori]MCL1140969.1 UDP-N-acetylmuramate dehydrogenase [Shewanella pneumatophori]
MPSSSLHSLKDFNTFGLARGCQQLVRVNTLDALIDTCCKLYQAQLLMLILGGGSNIVLCEDFMGTVVLVETKGIDIVEDDSYHYLTAAAGENWHDLVCFCLEQGFSGLENMALIPGTVGAAPIQNIGAYGVELNRFCDWVEYVDLSNGQLVRLSTDECEFGYRDSVFKNDLLGKTVITQVGFKLPKKWQPQLAYGPLREFDPKQVTPKQIFDCICETRRAKLPDPADYGNAGSFFKNPVIETALFESLTSSYPDMVGYPHGETHTKVAAGWLIDKAGLKGYQVGGAAVHTEQALVLINKGDATSDDVLTLAKSIVEKIKDKFGISLEAEPRMITATGERSL